MVWYGMVWYGQLKRLGAQEFRKLVWCCEGGMMRETVCVIKIKDGTAM